MPFPRGTEFIVFRNIPIENAAIAIGPTGIQTPLLGTPQTFIFTLPISVYVTNGVNNTLPGTVTPAEFGSGDSDFNFIQWQGTIFTNGLYVVARGAGDILAMFRVVDPPVPVLSVASPLPVAQKAVPYSATVSASLTASFLSSIEIVKPTDATKYDTTPSVTINVPYSNQIFSAVGLPNGLSMSPLGVISGTPIPSSMPGPDLSIGVQFGFKILSQAESISAFTTLKVKQARPRIVSANSATAYVGQPFAFTISAPETQYNSVAAAITLGGDIPAGLTMGATDASGNAILGGTPTGPEPCPVGSFLPVFVTAANASVDGYDYQTLNLQIIDPHPPTIPAASVGAGTTIAPNVTISAVGDPKIYANETWGGYQVVASRCPTSFSATGLPAGLSISSSGFISGTPTTPGIYPVVVTASNPYGPGTGTITITISYRGCVFTNPDPNNACTQVVDWLVSTVGFNDQLIATNTPTHWSAANLPAGLSINASTGDITGTPTLVSHNTLVTLTIDNIGLHGSVPADPPTVTTMIVNIVATAAEITPAITSSLSPRMPSPNGAATGIRGVLLIPYQATATHCPNVWGAVGLPPGLSISASTGLVTGTPTTVGEYFATISATNIWGTGSAVVDFIISYPPPVVSSPLYTFGFANAVFSPDPLFGGGSPAGYHITATISDPSDVINAYGTTLLPAGLTLNSSTGVISGTPTVTPGVYTIGIFATNAGAHGGIPALPPVVADLKIGIYANPPTVTSISPEALSPAGGAITIFGAGFYPGATVEFGNVSFVVGTNAVVVDSNTISVTVPALPLQTDPYDVAVINPDGSVGIGAGLLFVVPAGTFIDHIVRFTSLYSTNDPIYDIVNTAGKSSRKARIFGMGTNVEVLFYSGIDSVNKKILNVYRRQNGTTSTRHGVGDLVFKGIAAIQVAPYNYKTVSFHRLAHLDCLLRSNGRIDMHAREINGVDFADQSRLLYASYQAMLIRTLDLIPPPIFGTGKCE